MGTQTRFCIYCGRKFEYDENRPPRFCLYCGKQMILPEQNAPAHDDSAHDDSEHDAPEQNAHEPDSEPVQPAADLRDNRSGGAFRPEDITVPESNAEFLSSAGERILTGWLPDGFSGSAKAEQSFQTPDFPFLLWAYAKNASGASYFCRKERIYSINKLIPNTENPFRPFDAYLDENAASVLGTNRIRLLKRIPASAESEKKLYETLVKHRQQIESQSRGNFIQYAVQGEYGAEGGKLYEAETAGRKSYLFLYTVMVADEFGSFSPMLLQSQARTNQMLMNFQMRGRVPFFNMPVQQGMPAIDTNPNVPFGSHRTDGMTTAMIVWLIPVLAGFQSDTLPTEAELRDFYRFIRSLKTAPETERLIGQVKEQLILRKMADEQQAANIMGQMVRDQQRSFDRRSAIMQDLNDHRDAIFQQRIAADNAAFDRRSRLQHEAIMGVDTYIRTDGTTVEADTRFDRVFQRDNDPTLLLGAPMTADVPFGWTELEKLK